ncbi:hypothetical protein H4219_003682 [Mycoemilia scoparia]|uniref:Major facilitator superfamily (MFS) profile domain-containing protein n=1 Tax=Mycoemilia scoparia TaxID=417184 RepID=A0A9W7ZZI4_9FUNG|nr:hypothetical protein H4219_003682 [Mycoemilia scoparia]
MESSLSLMLTRTYAYHEDGTASPSETLRGAPLASPPPLHSSESTFVIHNTQSPGPCSSSKKENNVPYNGVFDEGYCYYLYSQLSDEINNQSKKDLTNGCGQTPKKKSKRFYNTCNKKSKSKSKWVSKFWPPKRNSNSNNNNNNNNDNSQKPSRLQSSLPLPLPLSASSTITETPARHHPHKNTQNFLKSVPKIFNPHSPNYKWVILALSAILQMVYLSPIIGSSIYLDHFLNTMFKNHTGGSATATKLSWIFNVTTFINLGNTWSGIVLSKKYGYRICTTIGCTIVIIGMVATSFSTSAIWKLVLTQGVIYGFGASMLYAPTILLPAKYFPGSSQGIAFGIALSANNIGGIWLSPLVNFLLVRLGYGWTMRIMACMVTVVAIICVPFLIAPENMDNNTGLSNVQEDIKTFDSSGYTNSNNNNNNNNNNNSNSINHNNQSRRSGVFIVAANDIYEDLGYYDKENTNKNWGSRCIQLLRQAIKSSAAVPIILLSFLAPLASFGPNLYLGTSATSIGLSNSTASLLNTLYNVCGVVGNIGSGFLCDKIGAAPALFICLAVSCISTFTFWLPANSLSALVIFSVFLGMFGANYDNAIPPLLGYMFGDDGVDMLMPVITLIFGISGLIGTYITSVIYDSLDHQGRFWYTIIITGCFYSLASMVCLLVWVLIRRQVSKECRIVDDDDDGSIIGRGCGDDRTLQFPQDHYCQQPAVHYGHYPYLVL